jgi:hypothetical protein
MSRVQGSLSVTGRLTASQFDLPADSVNNAHVVATAAIAATKLQHRNPHRYSQPNTAATAETRVLHRCYGLTGTVVAVHAGSIVAAIGAATVTVDIKKNGTTILSAVITLDNANSAYVGEAGTLSVTSLAQGDVLTAVLTATAGGGTLPTGVYVEVIVDEDAE